LNILFDVNVILDALLDRQPFSGQALALMDSAERSVINGILCAGSATTLFYLLEKNLSGAIARRNIALLLEIFEIAPVTRAIIEESLASGFADFEDAVVHQSAVAINADGIVTRNCRDFKKSSITIYSPQELMTVLELA
jgi:predicted nucleic acid-binding protein